MSDKKYVLTEELRDRLIGNLEAMALADFYAHSNKEQAELLRNLPTVQATVVPRRIDKGAELIYNKEHENTSTD